MTSSQGSRPVRRPGMETSRRARSACGCGYSLVPTIRFMPDQPFDAGWLKLGALPGLCGACKHAKLNETQRGTAYLRCTRAAWDSTLTRYPRLPVTQCAGFDPASPQASPPGI